MITRALVEWAGRKAAVAAADRGSLGVGLVVVVGVVLIVGGLGGVGWRLAGGSQAAVDGGPVEVGVEVPVSAVDLSEREAVNSPVLTRDPTTPQLVAAGTRGDAPGPDCGMQLSGDGGASWWPVQVTDPLPDALQACFAAQAAFDAGGRLVYAFVGMAGPPPEPAGLWVTTSDDHAQSFSQPRRIAPANTVASALTVTEAGWQLAWIDRPDGGGGGEGGGVVWPVGGRLLAVGESGEGGVGEPRVVADPQALVAAPVMAADPDGQVVVAYYRLPAGVGGDADGETLTGQPWDLMVARRPAGQAEFDRPQVVAEVAVPPPVAPFPKLVSGWGIAAPGLAVGDGRICLSWTEQAETTLNAQLDCHEAGELQAAQASDPVQLGADLAGDTFQWLPQVAITESGRVGAVFYHHRADADHDRAVDAYATHSDGDGLSGGFSEPVRLSSQSFTGDQSPTTGWFGTRLGLLAPGGGQPGVAMWADSRNARPPAHATQNLMAATLTQPADAAAGGSAAPGWAGWTGAALAVAGLALVSAGLWHHRRRGRDRDGLVPADAVVGHPPVWGERP